MVWKPVYILLIILATLVDYYCGVRMGALPTKAERSPYMLFSLITGLTTLCIFKYYNFFADSMNTLFISLNMEYILPLANLLLPVGISFYTFQTLSYTFDVYKGKSQPEKHLGKFALYVMFFPQLMAGPIERAKQLLWQFHFNYKFQWTNISRGLRLILLGLFKKIVIADQLSPLVGHVFNNPEAAQAPAIYLALMFFVMQVYCDFSGYSDIARGSARLLSIELMENFNLPLFAKSFTSFWSQWHISLMNWFRDYVMFPLVKKKYKWPLVFMIVFFISGVWHGANWTFVVWGIYNGLMVIYTKSTLKWRSELLDRMGLKNLPGLRHVVQTICVVHIFAFGGFFFRVGSLQESWLLMGKMFEDVRPAIDSIIHNVGNARQELLYLGKDAISFYLIVGFVFLLQLFEWNLRKQSIDDLLGKMPLVVRYSIYTFAALSIALMSNIEESPFLYFQF